MSITSTSVFINSGSTFTTSLHVSLTIHAQGSVNTFIVSENPNFVGALWLAWPTTQTTIVKSYLLSDLSGIFGGSEQERRIYVAFSSSATDIGKFFDPTNSFGNPNSFNRFYVSSATVTDSIIFDTVAPTPVGPIVDHVPSAFQINSGAISTGDRAVTVDSYLLNASQMRIEEVASGDVFTSASALIPYTPSFAGFVLSDIAGSKRVIAQYQDLAGNLSPVFEQTIELLSSFVDYTVVINDGGPYSYSRNLKITVTIADFTLLSGLTSIWISEFENFSVRAEYATPDLPSILNAPFTYAFLCSPGEGLKTIYLRLYTGVGYGTHEDRVVSVFLDQTSPNVNPANVPDGKIVVINPETNGKATNRAQVTVAFQGVVSARSVIISNSAGFSGATWQPYSPETNFLFSHVLDISTGNGPKFVYVRFSDYSETGPLGSSIGNLSVTYIGQIEYDTLAPIIPIVSQCAPFGDGYVKFDGYQVDGYTRDGYFIKGYPRAIVINEDAQFVLLQPTTVLGVTKFFVRLTLTASGATQMRLSTTLDDNGNIPSNIAWIGYKQVYAFNAPPEAGILTVYVQFRDDAGNTTLVYSDTIEVVDGSPVVPGTLGPFVILINGGALKTNSSLVDLTLNAEWDETLEMIISEFDTFLSSVWQPYQTSVPYQFNNTSDGPKVVFVKFRITLTGGFLRESAVYSATITKDSKAPVLAEPPILINAGSPFTRDRTVNLLFNVIEDPVAMQIVNEADYNPSSFSTLTWIPYQSQIAWLLSDGNGNKRVFARFKDDIDNTTVFVSAAIIYNRDLPRAPVITTPTRGSVVNQRVIRVEGTAEPGAIVTVTVRPLR
jgi:hypothetical protein